MKLMVIEMLVNVSNDDAPAIIQSLTAPLDQLPVN